MTEPVKAIPADGVLGESEAAAKDTEVISISIDCILDTRLGTLARHNAELATNALKSNSYSTRTIDAFEGMPKHVFEEAYKARDKETLMHSVITNISFFLRRLIKDSLIEAARVPNSDPMVFEVNIHPYVLDAFEVEQLIDCMRFVTFSTSVIRVVSISPKQLTPEYCKENYQIMIMYDWDEWLSCHKAFFEKKGIPQMSIVAPEIFKHKAPTEEEIAEYSLKQNDPFRLTEKHVAPLFNLKLLPVSLFSINETITSDNAADLVNKVSVTQDDIEAYAAATKVTVIAEEALPEVKLGCADDWDLL
jgi:hypothetical protein